MRQVTIGMPVFNGERFIERALSSLLRQSFQDFAIVVSDNASTDDTAEIVERISTDDERLSLVRQPGNLGASANFIYLASIVETPLFMWAAADDTWSQDYLHLCVRKLVSDANLAFTSGDIVSCDFAGSTVRRVPQFLGLDHDDPAVRLRRFAAQREAVGKANLVYSLFRSEIITGIAASAQETFSEWGGDMALVAAALERGRYLPAGESAVLYKQAGSQDDIETNRTLATGHYHRIQYAGSFPPDRLASFSETMTRLLAHPRHKKVVARTLKWRQFGTARWQIAQRLRNLPTKILTRVQRRRVSADRVDRL